MAKNINNVILPELVQKIQFLFWKMKNIEEIISC
jgi:hypothetical protein